MSQVQPLNASSLKQAWVAEVVKPLPEALERFLNAWKQYPRKNKQFHVYPLRVTIFTHVNPTLKSSSAAQRRCTWQTQSSEFYGIIYAINIMLQLTKLCWCLISAHLIAQKDLCSVSVDFWNFKLWCWGDVATLMHCGKLCTAQAVGATWPIRHKHSGTTALLLFHFSRLQWCSVA